MISDLNSTYNSAGCYFREDTPRNWAVAGTTITDAESSIDAWLLEHTANAGNDFDVFLLNWGANDVNSALNETAWKASYRYVIDALLTKYTGAKLFITKPGKRGEAADCTTLAGWIDDLVGEYAISNPNHVYVGDDERVWFENGDDYVSLSRLNDGTHYNYTTGMVAAAAAKKAPIITALGY